MFKDAGGDWVALRKLPGLVEVDFHWSDRSSDLSYWEKMGEVYSSAWKALIQAQQDGNQYVMFRHGASTSRIGKSTARSTVRGLMRGKEATPYILRSQCIQHESVFVAAIRPKAPTSTV